jgi:hypothetical protein
MRIGPLTDDRGAPRRGQRYAITGATLLCFSAERSPCRPSRAPCTRSTRINRTMADTVQAIITTGCAFHDAQKQLKHGGWQRLFEGHPEAVADPVRCTRQTAFMFMAIAKNPLLSNVKHVQHLPPSWGTLRSRIRGSNSRLCRDPRRVGRIADLQSGRRSAVMARPHPGARPHRRPDAPAWS